MHSLAYDPRTASALAREHIDRQLGAATADRLARSAQGGAHGATGVAGPLTARAGLWKTLSARFRLLATSGGRLHARAS
jgi:hypothetical protein